MGRPGSFACPHVGALGPFLKVFRPSVAKSPAPYPLSTLPTRVLRIRWFVPANRHRTVLDNAARASSEIYSGVGRFAYVLLALGVRWGR